MAGGGANLWSAYASSPASPQAWTRSCFRSEYLAGKNRILGATLNRRLRFSDVERAPLAEVGFRFPTDYRATFRIQAASVSQTGARLGWSAGRATTVLATQHSRDRLRCLVNLDKRSTLLTAIRSGDPRRYALNWCRRTRNSACEAARDGQSPSIAQQTNAQRSLIGPIIYRFGSAVFAR